MLNIVRRGRAVWNISQSYFSKNAYRFLSEKFEDEVMDSIFFMIYIMYRLRLRNEI